MSERLGECLITIEITRSEIEAFVKQRLRSGAFVDAEDVIFQALQSSAPERTRPASSPAKDMAELFANSPFAGLDMNFERDGDAGRRNQT